MKIILEVGQKNSFTMIQYIGYLYFKDRALFYSMFNSPLDYSKTTWMTYNDQKDNTYNMGYNVRLPMGLRLIIFNKDVGYHIDAHNLIIRSNQKLHEFIELSGLFEYRIADSQHYSIDDMSITMSPISHYKYRDEQLFIQTCLHDYKGKFL